MALFSAAFLILFVTLSLGIYRYILYPIFISPLARIPNAHWSVPLTSCWISWSRYTQKENRSIYAAHERCGPIVRLGPEEVGVNCVNRGIRTIYGAGFDKGDWYGIFNNYGVPCMFSTKLTRPHSVRKRMISNVYSKSTIQASPASKAQASHIIHKRLLPLLSSSEFQNGSDVWEVWMGCTMDLITSYLFGLSHSTNFLQNTKERQEFMKLYKSRKGFTFWAQEFPLFTKIIHSLPILRLYPTFVDGANREIEAFVGRLCDATLESIEKNQISSKAEDEPVVVNAMLAGLQKESNTKGVDSVLAESALAKPRLSIASEMLDHLAAGMETSGITLTYISWHLSKDQALQDALRTELRSLDQAMFMSGSEHPDTFQMPDIRQIDNLPLLHAILMETLRVEAAIPGSQPRVSPYPSSELCGYSIPGGTRVSAAAYGLHRNEEAFPDALKWKPSRWMSNGKSEDQRERDRYFWAFGSGGKMCIGSNFAMHDLKLLMVAIWTNFRTYVVNDEGIEPTDGYTCGPRSERLVLRFEKIGDEE